MEPSVSPKRSNFRHFFLRGLAILLPSVLTIWILVTAYNFVKVRIAEPINKGVREAIVQFTDWPIVLEADKLEAQRTLTGEELKQYNSAADPAHWLSKHVQRAKLERQWSAYSFPLDAIGLIIAIIVIYIVGGLLGSYIGHRIYRRGELFLSRIPLIRYVYPSVKQVTDFLVGGGDDEAKARFSRVVAVQYPRKGIWSVGLVTGETMRVIEDHAGARCLTVFVPSSPTPFTGYVITVPEADTIDLPVSIEDALRFTISGGVVIPESQLVDRVRQSPPAAAISGVGN